MRLWQLYVVTIVLAVAAVFGAIWFGQVIGLAMDGSAARQSCAARSPTGNPNDPVCKRLPK